MKILQKTVLLTCLFMAFSFASDNSTENELVTKPSSIQQPHKELSLDEQKRLYKNLLNCVSLIPNITREDVYESNSCTIPAELQEIPAKNFSTASLEERVSKLLKLTDTFDPSPIYLGLKSFFNYYLLYKNVRDDSFDYNENTEHLLKECAFIMDPAKLSIILRTYFPDTDITLNTPNEEKTAHKDFFIEKTMTGSEWAFTIIGEYYLYDSEKKRLYKNSSVITDCKSLCRDLYAFSPTLSGVLLSSKSIHHGFKNTKDHDHVLNILGYKLLNDATFALYFIELHKIGGNNNLTSTIYKKVASFIDTVQEYANRESETIPTLLGKITEDLKSWTPPNDSNSDNSAKEASIKLVKTIIEKLQACKVKFEENDFLTEEQKQAQRIENSTNAIKNSVNNYISNSSVAAQNLRERLSNDNLKNTTINTQAAEEIEEKTKELEQFKNQL